VVDSEEGAQSSRELEHLIRFRAVVPDELIIPRPGYGAKLSICYFSGGEFKGPRVKGRLLPGGGDWAEYENERLFRINVRSVLETDDHELITSVPTFIQTRSIG